MTNKDLSFDYIKRAKTRLKVLELLYKEESWPDVVREAQEVVDLALKALLRFSNIAFPRTHDLSNILKQEVDQLPSSIKESVPKLAKFSKQLRRDRELAFYGSEDITPLDFYDSSDAEEAIEMAKFCVNKVSKVVI